MTPSLTTHPLIRADGSATFSSALFTILAAVNGPLEVQRRDELPEEAAIEVNVRPSSGVGGPRERWLESVLHSLLRSVVLVHLHPRTLVQVTLQVTKEPVGRGIKRGVRDVAIVSALANAAFAALVDGGVPLERSVSAAFAVVGRDGTIIVQPTEMELMGCRSAHAMVFAAQGGLLLDESAGSFDVGVWQDVVERLRIAAVAAVAKGVEGEDEAMENGDAEGEKKAWLRDALEESVRRAGAWREDG